MAEFRIGEVAARSGIAASAIRYYESEGLLATPDRRNGWRVYDESILDQLRLIELAKAAGFSVAEIKRLGSGFSRRTPPGERWRETGNAYYGIHRAFKKAGLYRKGKLTHEIRRAVASTMLLNGTPIHVVKEILGHSTIKTTELYAFSNEEARKAATKNALV